MMKKGFLKSPMRSSLTIIMILFIGYFFITSSGFCSGLFSKSIKKEDENIRIKLDVKPGQVEPGGSGVIKVKIEPSKGIKLTKYPQTTITVTCNEGVAFENAVIKLGQDTMPKDIKDNFLKKIEPLEFKFKVDKSVEKEVLDIKTNISYFYCESSSGFCAPGTKNIDFQIPVKKKKS